MTIVRMSDQTPVSDASAESTWPHSRPALRAVLEFSVILVLVDLALAIAVSDEMPIDSASWARFISACLLLAVGIIGMQRAALRSHGERARRVWWAMGRGLTGFALFILPLRAWEPDLWRQVAIACAVCYPIGALLLWLSGEAVPQRRIQRAAGTA